MNYYDAHEIMRRHDAGLPINYGGVEEARAYLARERRSQPAEAAPAKKPAPPRILFDPPPTNDTLCECGLRYGQHRVNDYACPNQDWSPGNGKPQWLKAKFQRKQSPTAAHAAQP